MCEDGLLDEPAALSEPAASVARTDGGGEVRVEGETGEVLEPEGEKGEEVAAALGGRRVERKRSLERRRK